MVRSVAGALSLGYGWKGALAIYLPDGSESNTFDDAGLYVYYVLRDFGGYLGWLPVLGVVLTLAITGLPGFPALMAIPWLIVTFAGLGLHKEWIYQQEPQSVV